MAYFLFIDESGHDLQNSPYEVIGGITIEDKLLWSFIQEIQLLERRCFGTRYSERERELKGKKILKKKTFRLARQLPAMLAGDMRRFARICLEAGATAGKNEITALAQAKLTFVRDVLRLCKRFGCKVFAVMSETIQKYEDPFAGMLRKDYVYLFERFYYFLTGNQENPTGIIIYDELEKSQSHILLDQMSNYFKKTHNGRERASLIVPEPLFVHSDLSTGIQIADLVVYLLCWGFRLNGMDKTPRKELLPFIKQIKKMRHRRRKIINGQKKEVWSICYVNEKRQC